MKSDAAISQPERIAFFQKGFNYSQDGTGNRLVYHLQGCNLKCPWCSNPEGMVFSGRELHTLTVGELKEEILRCRPMFFDGGGVTFTGGEATCQLPALKKLLEELKGEGISTALETNGTSPRLPELFPLLEELIMDLKHWDTAKHKAVTGLGNERIRENLELAFREHPKLLVRIPLIGGFNASDEDMEQFLRFFTANPTGGARFEVLPYHEYGKDKWKKCGKEYTVTNGFVPEETRRKFEAMMGSHGLQVVRT